MTASWDLILREILTGALQTVFTLLKVLIPLMIAIEFLWAYKIMDKLARRLTGLARFLGIEAMTMLPLLVTTFMGVSYGAGALIELNRANPIPKRDIILIGVFFFICHALIETTAIWGAAGASVWIVSVLRLAAAAAAMIIAARLPWIRALGTTPAGPAEPH